MSRREAPRGPDRPRDPARLGGMIGRVLGELGHGRESLAMRLAGEWADAVGPELARHCEPTGLRGGVLEVSADSPAWSQHLQLRQGHILAALRERLGAEAPTELRLRVR